MARIRVGAVIDWSTESQRFGCLLKRARHCFKIKTATVVAVPIRKLARTMAMLRKATC
jgi:hypothetical protein